MASYDPTVFGADSDLAIAVTLLSLLAFATLTDFMQQRIPNSISLGAAVVGLGMQVALYGASGLAFGAVGWGVGLVCFLPFYIGGGMAAGDVKLMAAVGAFLGPIGAFAACMATLVTGAVVAAAWLFWHCCLARPRGELAVSAQMRDVDSGNSAVASGSVAGAKMPYAIAIAIGTALVVVQPPFVMSLLSNGGWS